MKTHLGLRILFGLTVGFSSMALINASLPEKRDPRLPKGDLVYYEMRVDLVHKTTGKDIHIRYPFACGVRHVSNLAGEGATRSSIYPRLYGATLPDDSGVVVQTPNICGSSIPLERMVPADFLPIVLYAPDRSNPEFMIAHLSEDSYMQEASKLEFRSASIKALETLEVDAAKLSGGFVPDDFLASKEGYKYACTSALPVPMPDEFRETVRDLWPKSHPDYWVLKDVGDKRKNLAWDIYQRIAEMDRAYANYVYYASDGHESLRRKSGEGNLFLEFEGRKSGYGTLDLMPISEGMPAPNPNREIRYTFHREGGLDKGFAYCSRGQLFPYTAEERARQKTIGAFLPVLNVIAVDNTVIDARETSNAGRDRVVGWLFYRDQYAFHVVSHVFD